MTKGTLCRDFERLALEAEDRALTEEDRRILEEHVRGCERCRGYASDRALIRGELASASWPEPSDELVARTRRRLREQEPAPAAVPAWVLVALAVVTVVTALWLTVSLADVTPDMTLADLPVAGLAAVFIVIQNALMLLFAPIVLRAVRTRRGASESA
jgi:predicted anti-sigma-YlaC factor YlaD